MTRPDDFSFTRYLAAKKTVDDRALNRYVWEALARAVRDRQDPAPLRVLEVGCGIGTMLERLLERGVLRRAAYRGIDALADNIREARRRLPRFAAGRDANCLEKDGMLQLKSEQYRVAVHLETIDLLDFLPRERGRSYWDLLLAHAFLDLVDLPTTLPSLLSLLAPGGLFYFTLNFDGATLLLPPVDPGLDRRITDLYHRTMDERRVNGRPSGDSRTGRRLFHHLKAAGARLAAAGSSDWVVFAGESGYPAEEAYFLRCIIHTIQQALRHHPELEADRFQDWVRERQAQIDRAELVYIAHQLDFFGYI